MASLDNRLQTGRPNERTIAEVETQNQAIHKTLTLTLPYPNPNPHKTLTLTLSPSDTHLLLFVL